MKIFFAGAALAFVLGAPIAAQNIVTNGGFEDGLTGWTQVGDWGTGYDYVNCSSGCHLQVGNYPAQGLAGVSQAIATDHGATYKITIDWLATGNNDPENQEFDVFWNGDLLGQITGAFASASYTPLLFNVTGHGSDALTIKGFSSSGYNFVDDVSVVQTAAAPPGGVPEPASWALMVGGFGLVGSALRTRRRIAFA